MEAACSSSCAVEEHNSEDEEEEEEEDHDDECCSEVSSTLPEDFELEFTNDWYVAKCCGQNCTLDLNAFRWRLMEKEYCTPCSVLVANKHGLPENQRVLESKIERELVVQTDSPDSGSKFQLNSLPHHIKLIVLGHVAVLVQNRKGKALRDLSQVCREWWLLVYKTNLHLISAVVPQLHKRFMRAPDDPFILRQYQMDMRMRQALSGSRTRARDERFVLPLAMPQAHYGHHAQAQSAVEPALLHMPLDEQRAKALAQYLKYRYSYKAGMCASAADRFSMKVLFLAHSIKVLLIDFNDTRVVFDTDTHSLTEAAYHNPRHAHWMNAVLCADWPMLRDLTINFDRESRLPLEKLQLLLSRQFPKLSRLSIEGSGVGLEKTDIDQLKQLLRGSNWSKTFTLTHTKNTLGGFIVID